MENQMQNDSRPIPLLEQALSPFRRFSHIQASGGLVLIACTIIALVWANSP